MGVFSYLELQTGATEGLGLRVWHLDSRPEQAQLLQRDGWRERSVSSTPAIEAIQRLVVRGWVVSILLS